MSAAAAAAAAAAAMDERLITPSTDAATAAAKAWSRDVIGYGSLFGLIIAWVAQSEVAQALETKLGYNKPCFVSWVNHSFSVLLFPLLLASHYASPSRRSSAGGWLASLRAQGLTGRVALVASAQLATVFLLGDFMWYIGLAHTSVAMGSAIFNSSCAITYGLSLLLLRQRPTLLAVAALVVTLAGAGLVSFAPTPSASAHSHAAPDTPAPPASPPPALGADAQTVGNLLCLGAAACYAVYEVWTSALLQRYGLPSSAEVVNTINACMGLFNLAVLWVAVVAVQLVPPAGPLVWVHEQFAWPSAEQAGYLVLNALLALAFNVFLMLGVAFTSPTLTSVSCVAAIPVAALVDWLLWGKGLTRMALGGSALIIVGFAGLAVVEHRESRARASAAANVAPAACVPSST